jgi:CMP-N-acetylneuraminic acid synthetase
MSELILGLVPARAGSKGVPDKNLRPLAGRPLLDYTAESARASGVIDRLVLSTDSPAIAAVGREAGMEVPFERPADLARDDTPMLPVIQHALQQLAGQGWQPDILVLLQPTSPLRRGDHIRDAVTMLRDTGADSVVSVVEMPRHLSPDFVLRLDEGRLRPFLDGPRVTRRQDARASFARDGTVYVCWRATLERFGDIYGQDCRPIINRPGSSVSIDSPDDWDAAERALSNA